MQVFFNRDQNGKQRRTVFVTKRLFNACLSQFSESKFFSDRSKGIVSRPGWKKILRASVESRDAEPIIQVYNAEVEVLERDTGLALDKLK